MLYIGAAVGPFILLQRPYQTEWGCVFSLVPFALYVYIVRMFVSHLSHLVWTLDYTRFGIRTSVGASQHKILYLLHSSTFLPLRCCWSCLASIVCREKGSACPFPSSSNFEPKLIVSQEIETL